MVADEKSTDVLGQVAPLRTSHAQLARTSSKKDLQALSSSSRRPGKHPADTFQQMPGACAQMMHAMHRLSAKLRVIVEQFFGGGCKSPQHSVRSFPPLGA